MAVGRSAVDAALGSRFLGIDVRNCTARPVTLTRPVVTGVTGDGRTGQLLVVLTPVANRPDKPFTLAAGKTASAGLEWRAEPRTDRIQELRVAATHNDTAHVLSLSVLEMRLSTRLDYYPWVSRPRDVFS